ncbi:hypothetical protein Glove_499g74 [Diversispora epigaea]|uniref:Uncharacterized protein n=1 Tax=Diversispora epigaea TaxID=1348612 RepID=A0A397GHH2_9GLOM|nr:hypothetical protein Glove_499g74 [Diversispora epigaea]
MSQSFGSEMVVEKEKNSLKVWKETQKLLKEKTQNIKRKKRKEKGKRNNTSGYRTTNSKQYSWTTSPTFDIRKEEHFLSTADLLDTEDKYDQEISSDSNLEISDYETSEYENYGKSSSKKKQYISNNHLKLFSPSLTISNEDYEINFDLKGKQYINHDYLKLLLPSPTISNNDLLSEKEKNSLKVWKETQKLLKEKTQNIKRKKRKEKGKRNNTSGYRTTNSKQYSWTTSPTFDIRKEEHFLSTADLLDTEDKYDQEISSDSNLEISDYETSEYENYGKSSSKKKQYISNNHLKLFSPSLTISNEDYEINFDLKGKQYINHDYLKLLLPSPTISNNDREIIFGKINIEAVENSMEIDNANLLHKPLHMLN